MRALTYQLKNEILDQEDKDILTSCSVPNWQTFRIKHARKKLMQDLKTAGVDEYICEGKVELLALKLLVRKLNGRKKYTTRAVRYNKDRQGYSKINIHIERNDDYFLLRSKRSHLRVSVSYLMDLALRLYLHVAARIIYLRLTKVDLKSKWHKLIDQFSNYNENISQDNHKGLVFSESSIIGFDTG